MDELTHKTDFRRVKNERQLNKCHDSLRRLGIRVPNNDYYYFVNHFISKLSIDHELIYFSHRMIDYLLRGRNYI